MYVGFDKDCPTLSFSGVLVLPAEINKKGSSLRSSSSRTLSLNHLIMFALPSFRFCRTACPQAFGQARQASSKRWQARQHKDQFTKEAAVQGLKSRAAFKLLQVYNNYITFA